MNDKIQNDNQQIDDRTSNIMENMFASLQISDVSSTNESLLQQIPTSQPVRSLDYNRRNMDPNCCDLNNASNYFKQALLNFNDDNNNNKSKHCDENEDYTFLLKIFQTLLQHQDFVNYAFFDGNQQQSHSSNCRKLSLLYQLIIKQLSFDGHCDIAQALFNKLSDMNDISILQSGNDTLFKLFNIMFYIEIRSKTDEKFSNLLNWFFDNTVNNTTAGSQPNFLCSTNIGPITVASSFSNDGSNNNNTTSATINSQLFHSFDSSSVIYETESDGPMSLSLNDASVGSALPLQVAYKFGQIGSEPGCLDTPHGFCLGVNDDIVIADTNNHRICVFAFNGKFKFSFGEYGTEMGKLHQPRKIAMLPPAILRPEDSDPIFIVCDRGSKRSRMQVFAMNGDYVRLIDMPPMDIVSGLTTTQDRRIIVVDSVRSSLIVMDETGGLLNWFTCSPHMMEPSDIAVHNKHFYICDFKGHNICVFDAHGVLVRRLSAKMLRFPNGIDVSNRGDIICGDSHGNRFHISVFNEQGQLIADYNCPFVKVSRCCGLRISAGGCIVTLAKNNNHAVVMNAITVRTNDIDIVGLSHRT